MKTTTEGWKHIMIDTLPLGADSNSVIISIAAVPFRFEDNETLTPFIANINIESSLRRGLRVNGHTLEGMLRSFADVQDYEPLFINPKPLKDVMQSLHDYIRDFGADTFPWAKGAGYDLPLLRDAFRCAGVNPPWRFPNERCVRTIGWLRPDIRVRHESMREADRKVPVDQCMMQIGYVRQIMQELAMQ